MTCITREERKRLFNNSGCCSKHQRKISKEIKKSRNMGYLSYIANLKMAKLNNKFYDAEHRILTGEMREFFENVPISREISREAMVEFAEKNKITGMIHESDAAVKRTSMGKLKAAYSDMILDTLKKMVSYYQFNGERNSKE